MDVRRFTRSDLPFAAGLLAARGNAHPLAAPFDAAEEVTRLLDEGHEGYVAGTGFLVGKVGDDAAWVEYAGHAATDVETYRHLYRAIGRDWVAAGQRRHAVVMPEGDQVAGPAFADLAFGREHVFALATLADQPAGPPGPAVEVREVTSDGFDVLRPLVPTLARHLAEAPVWSPRPESYYDALEEAFREDVAEPHTTYLLAWVDGRAVGVASWEPMPPRIHVPAGAYALSHMSVLPEHRGRGAGRALTLAGLDVARARGATVTWTDWRLTNMSAEPYWRGYGWRPYAVRMTRRVEPQP